MNDTVRRGLFIGLDDARLPTAVSVVSGSLSASILHTEFESRCALGEWELVVPDGVSHLTRAFLLERLMSFLTASQTDGPVLIYFAGHGCSVGGRYIFCPGDFNSKLPNETGLPIQTISSVIERFSTDGRTFVIIFDTCRALLDNVPETGGSTPPNAAVIYTCGYGDEVIEIEGSSDFVRSLQIYLSNAARSHGESAVRIGLADVFEGIQESRVREGSGRPIRMVASGQRLNRFYFSLRAEPGIPSHRAVEIRLRSRPKASGAYRRLQGEILNRLAFNMGVPIDRRLVRLITKGNAELVEIAFPVTQPMRSARVLDNIVRQWTYCFTELTLFVPSLGAAERIRRQLRTQEFMIVNEAKTVVAIRRTGAVLAKVEVDSGKRGSEVRITCVKESEHWGLERLGDLFFSLVRDFVS